MRKLATTILVILVFAYEAAVASPSNKQQWSFRVLLDGKPVGEQNFVVTNENGLTRLETEADFRVKFLFATVYRYEHQNVETWDGNCLTGIESTTDANGQPFSVTGQKKEGYFEVIGEDSRTKLPDCVMSFAYWNPDFLQHERLLNSQNGEYMEVEVSAAQPDTRMVRGERVPALRYQLKAGDLDLRLWYSTNDEWLALESITEGDRVLSYELL